MASILLLHLDSVVDTNILGGEDCFDCKQNSIQRFTHVFPLFVAPKQQKCFVTEMCSPLTIYDSCNAEGAEEMSGDKSLVWL